MRSLRLPLAVLALLGASLQPAAAHASSGAAETSKSRWRAELDVDQREEGVFLRAVVSGRIPLGARPDAKPLDALRACPDGHRASPTDLVRFLVGTAAGSARYRCARTELLDGSGLFPEFGDFTAVGFPSPTSDEPRTSLNITKGSALLRVASTGWILQADPQHVGPWILDPDSRRGTVRISLVLPARQGYRSATVRLKDLSLADGEPLPEKRAGRTWVWSTGKPDEPRRVVDLTVRLDESARWTLFRQDASLGRWISSLISFLFPAIVVLLAIRYVGPDSPQRIPLRALGAVILLAVAAITLQTVFVASRFFDAAAWGVSQGALSTVASAICVWAATRSVGGRRWVPIIAIMTLGAAWCWLLARTNHQELSGLTVLVMLVLGGVILAAGIAGLGRIALLAMPLPRIAWICGAVGVLIVIGVTVMQNSRELFYVVEAPPFFPFHDALPSSDEFLRAVAGSQPFRAGAVVGQLAALVPYAVAGLAVVAARDSMGPTRTLMRRPRIAHLLVLLFAAFVIGGGGQRWGLSTPIAFLAAVLVLGPTATRLTNTKAIRELDRYRSGRAALLRRALRLERLRTARRALQAMWSSAELDTAEFEQKDRPLEREEVATAPLIDGQPIEHPGRSRDLVLAGGPRDTWWANVKFATQAGAILGIVPVAYYLSVVLEKGLDQSGPRGSSTTLSGLVSLSHEIAFWLFAAFCLGGVLSLLPRSASVLKGLLLAAIFAAFAGLGAAVAPAPDEVDLRFRIFELLLFLMLLGLWLDLNTVGRWQWRWLRVLYRLQDVGPAVAYAAPVLAALIVIAQQVLSGDAQQAIQETVSRGPTFIPGAQPR
jgi:hypothetical protein